MAFVVVGVCLRSSISAFNCLFAVSYTHLDVYKRQTLKGGGKVTLVGFGTFSVSKRAARNGRNPQTGEVIKIKARKVAKFKAGKELAGKLKFRTKLIKSSIPSVAGRSFF